MEQAVIGTKNTKVVIPKYRPKITKAKTKIKSLITNCKRAYIRTQSKGFDSSVFDGKTIAIVGNGQSILNHKFGPEIDKFDIVCRFNVGHPFTINKKIQVDSLGSDVILDSFKDKWVVPAQRHLIANHNHNDFQKIKEITNIESLGQKTHVWSCATRDKARQAFYSKHFNEAVKIWGHPSVENIESGLLKDVQIIPNDTYFELKSKLDIEPSSGLILIEFFKQLSNIKNVSLFGFDFFELGHSTRTNQTKHMFKGIFPHSALKEKEYILSIIDQDPRFSIFGYERGE
jgi:hypothetical protein